jgi:hypothetical protein
MMDCQLDRNAQGRPILTLRRARLLAERANSAGRWYIAPFATKWTVGVTTAEGRFHVLDERDEPLCFDSRRDAWKYLRAELKVPVSRLPAADDVYFS